MRQPEASSSLNDIVQARYDDIFVTIRARLTIGLGVRSTGERLTSEELHFGSTVATILREQPSSSFYTTDETVIKEDATPVRRALYFAKLGHQVIRTYRQPLHVVSDTSAPAMRKYVERLHYQQPDFQQDNLELRNLTDHFMSEVDNRSEQRDFSHSIVMTCLSSIEEEYQIERFADAVEEFARHHKQT